MIRKLLLTATACAFSLQGAAYADTPAAPGSDSEITDQVIHKISETEPQAAKGIHVSTANGVVTLEGRVSTNSQMLAVLQDVRTVPGVTKVQNRLTARM
jgi:osmotically-inducible protein OsmY